MLFTVARIRFEFFISFPLCKLGAFIGFLSIFLIEQVIDEDSLSFCEYDVVSLFIVLKLGFDQEFSQFDSDYFPFYRSNQAFEKSLLRIDDNSLEFCVY